MSRTQTVPVFILKSLHGVIYNKTPPVSQLRVRVNAYVSPRPLSYRIPPVATDIDILSSMNRDYMNAFAREVVTV